MTDTLALLGRVADRRPLDCKRTQHMIEITAGTVVTGTVGILFGVMFDAAILQPLHDTSYIEKAARPESGYATPFPTCVFKGRPPRQDTPSNTVICI